MDRRTFVHSIAGTVAGVGLGQAACAREAPPESAGGGAAAAAPPVPAAPVGIQLYTLRSLMSADPERTLATLAEIGYREVELAGLYKLSARDFRAMLDRNGLRAPAAHIGIAQLRGEFDKTLDDAATLGHEWIVIPWIDDKDRTLDGLTRLTADFNRLAAAVKQRGLRFGYHNHDFEFTRIGDVVPFDLLLQKTDRALVFFELDLFWLRKGGRDPLDLFARYPGRFPMLHVKDMAADGKMVNVGEGVMDFASVFARAQQAGIQHYFVEHDNPTDPIRDVRVSFDTVQKLLSPK